MMSENPFSLAGKTLLVTGASSGIGKSVAILCSRMGATVCITARREKMLKETLAEMEGDSHVHFVSDLANQGSVESLVDALPKLDGIVHCAGIGSRQLCKNVTRENVHAVMEVNFVGPVMLQNTLLNKKKLNKGSSIVFIASHAATSPALANSIYSASKGALISYAKCLALELAPRNIRVNCISPAMVWTDLIEKDGLDKDTLMLNEQTYPLGRFGQPNDIAPLAVYLLSDSSRWMTTSNIKISGGC